MSAKNGKIIMLLKGVLNTKQYNKLSDYFKKCKEIYEDCKDFLDYVKVKSK